ncbi:hypothetical protein DFH09DRAFT_1363964, partial [Mycena vulgaris]
LFFNGRDELRQVLHCLHGLLRLGVTERETSRPDIYHTYVEKIDVLDHGDKTFTHLAEVQLTAIARHRKVW